MSDTPVALITGGAKRIGAAIARRLHQNGYNLVLHYRDGGDAATQLQAQLQALRPESVITVAADLNRDGDLAQLAAAAEGQWQRLDLLVNNASRFYPTPIGSVEPQQWDDLMASNLRAPFFLAQALAPALTRARGTIINLVDVYAERPLANHPVYCAAKAGNAMLVKSLARDLAPAVRVNGVAPGAILWPSHQDEFTDEHQLRIREQVPLQRPGSPDAIAEAVLYLAGADYVTGQILAVDGGRSLRI